MLEIKIVTKYFLWLIRGPDSGQLNTRTLAPVTIHQDLGLGIVSLLRSYSNSFGINTNCMHNLLHLASEKCKIDDDRSRTSAKYIWVWSLFWISRPCMGMESVVIIIVFSIVGILMQFSLFEATSKPYFCVIEYCAYLKLHHDAPDHDQHFMHGVHIMIQHEYVHSTNGFLVVLMTYLYHVINLPDHVYIWTGGCTLANNK